MQVIAVTPENHANKTWKPAKEFSFVADQVALPVVQAEAAKVASLFPLAIHQRGDAFDLLALFGVKPGINLAVAADGRWMARYVPAYIRVHPFSMARPKDAKDMVLCVDESTGLVKTGGDGEGFFDAAGKPTKPLSAMVDFLRHVAESRQQTRLACKALASAGVLKPLNLTLRGPEGQTSPEPTIKDLFMVDRAKLAALSPEAFVALRSHDALSLAYTQLLSMNQFEVLDHLARARQGKAASQNRAPSPGVPGLTVQDSVLKFI